MFRQTVQFIKTPDNVKLAYALSGTGPMLVKCGNWLSHLDFDWESPVWRHWFEFLSSNFTLLRYDERGCGLSDWSLPSTGFDKWIDDLDTIVEANELDKFPLLGISRGAAVAIEYAHRYPERVSHLVLYGGFARGRSKSGSKENEKQDTLMKVMEAGWEDQNPAFRQLFASLFVPNGSKEHQQWFAELCRKTANTKNALRIQQIASDIEISEKLCELNVPTLVIHAKDDAVVPIGAGRFLASEIPNAQYVQIESENHLLLPDEPAWQVFCDEVLRFLKQEEPGLSEGHLDLEALTAKEQNILNLLGEGLSNAGIAEKVFLSEKTIRNHLTNIYDKLGVSSRTEAIVRVRSKLGISS